MMNQTFRSTTNRLRERRGRARVHCPLSALCRISRPTFQRVQVLDLSEGGARLLVDQEVQVGARMTLHITLESQRSVCLEVEAVRVNSREVGVRHIDGSLADLRFLSVWIHRRSLLVRLAGVA